MIPFKKYAACILNFEFDPLAVSMQVAANPSGKKRGRPFATDTPAFFKRQAIAAKSFLRKSELLSISGPKGCTKDGHNDVYAPSLISKLRIYFWSMSKVDQRKFLGPGVRCDLNHERMNMGGNLSNARILVNTRLERPEVLEPRLDAAIVNGSVLPVPAVSECHGRTQIWLHWAVGRSVTFSNQSDREHPSRANPMGAVDRTYQINPDRRVNTERPANKEELVVQWLQNQRQEHLVLPNEHATVLPYQDKREAHAMFVLEKLKRS